MTDVNTELGKKSAVERFMRDYCAKCARGCKEVDPGCIRVLDDGDLGCTRYRCAVLDWEW